LCVGFDDPVDPENPTPREIRMIHRNAQATSALISALIPKEYDKVIGLEIAKEIWDTLHLAHEGVSKVKKSKIDLLMAQLNRFVTKDGEGPQEMFDRLILIVGKITGLGGDDLDDHPYENKEDKKDKKKKQYKKDDKTQYKKKNYSGQAHIGHEWNSNDDSSSEEEIKKVATIAMKKHSSSPKLFTNLTDDEERSTLFCLMGKGENVKPKSKPKPSASPSDESDIDSSDESSNEEVNDLVSKMDKKI
jgi:hypothetical protein